MSSSSPAAPIVTSRRPSAWMFLLGVCVVGVWCCTAVFDSCSYSPNDGENHHNGIEHHASYIAYVFIGMFVLLLVVRRARLTIEANGIWTTEFASSRIAWDDVAYYTVTPSPSPQPTRMRPLVAMSLYPRDGSEPFVVAKRKWLGADAVFARTFAALHPRLSAPHPGRFAPVALGDATLSHPTAGDLAIAAIAEVDIVEGNLVVRTHGAVAPWLSMPFADVRNGALLIEELTARGVVVVAVVGAPSIAAARVVQR